MSDQPAACPICQKSLLLQDGFHLCPNGDYKCPERILDEIWKVYTPIITGRNVSIAVSASKALLKKLVEMNIYKKAE
jgi:hypothetical protein